MKKFKLVSFLITLVAMLSMSSCVERIDAGHEGIKVSMTGDERGVNNENLVTGWVFYNPFSTKVFEFPTFVQTIDYPAFTINAKDGSEFTVDPTLSVYVMTGKTPSIFQKYRKDLPEIVSGPMFNYTRDAFRIQMNSFTTDEIVSQRDSLEKAIEKALREKLNLEGFELDQLTSGLQYPQTIVESVNAKNKAIQIAMQKENELKATEADAKKSVVAAEAEQKVNALKQQSLTPLIIKQQFIEKWDGKYPNTVVGDANVLLNIN